MHTARRRGKSRSRILYWFRTPPGVRVGRSALDEDAIRLLEEHHPDVEFDWTRILKSPPETAPEPPPQRSRPARREEDADRRDVRVQPPPLETPPEPLPLAPDVEEIETTETGSESAPDSEAPSAAVARLGPEGLLRLRARYAELMTRITQRVADTAQQEELKARAERLNPDNWVTDEEVRQGLDGYEAGFEEIRSVVGRPRKRRRRRRGSRDETAGGPTATATDSAEPGDADRDYEAEPTEPDDGEDG